jgi:hypothetical protein
MRNIAKILLAVLVTASLSNTGAAETNSIGYSATVAIGQNTYVQSSNGTFGTILVGQSKIINNSVTLNNTGDVNATVDARFNDSRNSTYGLVSDGFVLNASNFALAETIENLAIENMAVENMAVLSDSGSDVRITIAQAFGAITRLAARLSVPQAQPAGDYSGTIILTFSNSE